MKRRQLRHGEEGAALLELALVMPVFLLVIFGILQCTLALFAYCNISYASHAAVRYASLYSSSSIAPATSTSVRKIVDPFIWCAPRERRNGHDELVAFQQHWKYRTGAGPGEPSPCYPVLRRSGICHSECG